MALQVAILTGLSSTQQSINDVNVDVLDVHEHVSELSPEPTDIQNAEYTDREQIISDFTKTLEYHECDGEYYIEVEMDGLLIYRSSDDRFLGFVPHGSSKIHKLIENDNR